MENGKIAVCVSVYNAETTIEDVLLSLIKQTYKEFYVFVIDDGSTDSTLKLCDEFVRAITFAGVAWPDIWVFKGETHKGILSGFISRLGEVLQKVEGKGVIINRLLFYRQDEPLDLNEIDRKVTIGVVRG